MCFFACKEKTNKTTPEIKVEQAQVSLTNDTTELEKLTKELYKWNGAKSSRVNFDALQIEKTDTIYKRIDLARHKQRLKELKETNFLLTNSFKNTIKLR